MIRIILADDHQVVRQGVKALIEAEGDMTIIGEVSDGTEVSDLVEQLKPDVLVLDLMMPGLNGLEVARQVNKRRPETRIVMLSMHANEAYVLQSLRHGASGYVLKDASISDLVKAVREVMAGRRYLSEPLSERAIDAYVAKVETDKLDPYETLTGREREVLQLTAEGHSSGIIGEKLSISPRTVETHRTNVMKKLNLKSQADLIRFALRRGIIPMDN